MSNANANSFEVVDQLSCPRTIKTHLPFDLLPKQTHQKQAKVFYVIQYIFTKKRERLIMNLRSVYLFLGNVFYSCTVLTKKNTVHQFRHIRIYEKDSLT